MTARMAHAAVNLRGIVIPIYSNLFKSIQSREKFDLEIEN